MAHPHIKHSKRMPDGTEILKEAPGGMKKIRCPRCTGLAVPVAGKSNLLQCQVCHTKFGMKSF
jgi:hypothetical protein